LKGKGYKIEILPYRAYNNKRDDAKGIYMNFLLLPDLIVMPYFNFDKEDKEAVETVKKLYPGRDVETVYGTDLAKKGGIINCITWQ